MDWDLQQEYTFLDDRRTNFWTNLFQDRHDGASSPNDEPILAYVRQDNYQPLRAALVVLLGLSGVCVSAWHGVAYTELATLAGAARANFDRAWRRPRVDAVLD